MFHTQCLTCFVFLFLTLLCSQELQPTSILALGPGEIIAMDDMHAVWGTQLDGLEMIHAYHGRV